MAAYGLGTYGLGVYGIGSAASPATAEAATASASALDATVLAVAGAGAVATYAIQVEFTAGVWTDIPSTLIPRINYRVGRESSASDSQPGVLEFEVENTDGTYTPDNPTSSLFPNWVEGKRVRVQITYGATYTVFVGRIANIEPDFPALPWGSRVQVTATDLLGELAGITLKNAYTAVIESKANIVGHYPLTDTAARRGASESRALLRDLTVWNRASGGSCDFDSAELVDVKGVSMTSGKGLWHARSAFSIPTANLIDFMLFVQVEDNSYGEVMSITDRPRSSAREGLVVRWTSSGFILDHYVAGAIVSSTTAYAVEPGWHSVLVSRENTMTTSLYIDGTAAGSGTDTSTASFTCVSIGGDLTLSAAMLSIADAPGSGLLGTEEILLGGGSLSDVISTTGSEWLKAITNLTSRSAQSALSGTLYDPSDSLAPLSTEGTSGLDLALKAARSAGGILYHEPSTAATQTIRFRTASAMRPTTVALTIDADDDLDGGPTMARDVNRRASAVTASSESSSVTAYDSTQIAGQVDLDTLSALDDINKAIAEEYLAASAATRLRPAQVAVDLRHAANDLHVAFLTLVPGDRVRLDNLPSAYFGVTYMDGYAEGWEVEITASSFRVVFDLSPADAPPEARWDTDRWGWGDGVCTTSVLTSSGTSITLTWTGSATLSTSAGDYPLDIDVNGERITLPSAPAGGTSPRTFTGITRGVAPTVARAHSAGETVDIWNAARWAM